MLECEFHLLRFPLRHCGSLSEIAKSYAMAERFGLPYLWAIGCGMSLLGEFWSCGFIFADAQTLLDELFAAKAPKTQFTAVLILR